MGQTFSERFDQGLKTGCLVCVASLLLLAFAAGQLVQSSWMTGEDLRLEQPIPFSHRHHVGQVELDCRYCHSSVETSSHAGFPSTETCMTCHSQLFTDAEVLEPARRSWTQKQPLRWRRVADLPDFVYFSHEVHVQNGVSCTECHGRVDRMSLTSQSEHYTMGWCLDCHRQPARRLRPAEAVFEPEWEPPQEGRAELARHLMKEYEIELPRLTECSSCHR